MWQRTILNTILTVLVCLFAMAGTGNAKTIYVDCDAAGANDGSSWPDAYDYLQDALMFATAGDEIRVAQGVYRPDDFVLSKRPNLGREETFQLKNGVILKGGYAGSGQPDPNARDIELYETVLSGDRDENDVEIYYAWNLIDEPTRAENSNHVVTGSGTDANAVLDGFTIKGGQADSAPPHSQGGGMNNDHGSPTVTDCIFTQNAALDGGGVGNYYGNPTLNNCTFSENSSFWGTGSGAGGGMSNFYGTPVLTGCVFIGNSSDRGGGIYNNANSSVCDGNSPTLVNCTFRANYAYWDGGGMSNNYDSPMVVNCTFIGNSAGCFGYGTGGGAISGNQTIATLINCTFSGNSADSYGGAIIFGEIPYATSRMVNCIFWDNDADEGPQIALYWSNLSVSYCDIQGGQANIGLLTCCDELAWGAGNIDSDPCFTEAGHWDNNVWVDGDYHLKSQAGRWDASEGRWLTDDVTSPCIDAGDPMSPIGLEPFPNAGIINMGAYGGTAEASKSYFGAPVCEIIVAGDINGDCEVNFSDLCIMALHWCEDHNL